MSRSSCSVDMRSFGLRMIAKPALSFLILRLSFAASCLTSLNLRLALLTDERQLSLSSQASSSCTSLLSSPSSSMAVRHGLRLLDSDTRIEGFENKFPRKLLRLYCYCSVTSLPLEHNSTTGCRARSTSLWAHRNLFWQLNGQETEIVRFGYVTRHDSLSKIILQGTLEGGQHRGR